MKSIKVGAILRDFRNKKKITLLQLAQKTGLSLSYISTIENNQRKPNIDILEQICQALNIPLEVILILASDSEDPLIQETLKPLVLSMAEGLYVFENSNKFKELEGVEALDYAASLIIRGGGVPNKEFDTVSL
jgi:transcriptional regulator with XRE-family HTH domain